MAFIVTTRRTNNDRFIICWLLIGVFFLCLWFPTQVIAAGTVNIYSYRQQVPPKPFLKAFTEELPIRQLAVLELEAQMIIDRVEW